MQASNDVPAIPPPIQGPRSLPECLRWLWSRVLFSGQTDAPTTWRWPSLLLLVAVPGLLLYPCLSFPLFEPDEGRYAEIPREMLARGEWVVPYLQGDPYLDKPPFLYWLVMLSYKVFGIHDWAARLVPALAVHACIMLIYWLGRRRLGERAAFWGALALGLAPGFLSVGRLLLLDGLLTLWVVLSLLAAFEAVRGPRLRWGWWLLAAAGCALGVLTKGPVALVLLLPPLGAHAWLTCRCCRVSWRAWVVFISVLLLLALPWYAAICFRLPEFGSDFFWRHNVVRFVSGFDHQRPVWFYLPILLSGLFPASLLLLPLARSLLREDLEAARRRSPELGFMLLAGGWCVLFFSISGCKLPTYILPAFPPLALVLGHYLACSRWQRSRWPAVGATVACMLLGVAHLVVLPWYARFHSPMSRPDSLVSYCGDVRTPVVCYPRNLDSVAFYLARDDLLTYRSKETPELIDFLHRQPRTVVLFTHRNSLQTLRQVLPPDMCLAEETPLFDSVRAGVKGWSRLLSKTGWFDTTRDSGEGLCWMAVVQRR